MAYFTEDFTYGCSGLMDVSELLSDCHGTHLVGIEEPRHCIQITGNLLTEQDFGLMTDILAHLDMASIPQSSEGSLQVELDVYPDALIETLRYQFKWSPTIVESNFQCLEQIGDSGLAYDPG